MSNAQKQAYINEFKGNLLEFLVAREIALELGSYKSFFSSISKNYLNLLTTYERNLRALDFKLFNSITSFALKVSSIILKNFNLNPEGEVFLVGKDSSLDVHEADIIYKDDACRLPFSLKFYKQDGFINTKSGGINSFFTKYFPFASSEVQERLNEKLDLYFDEFSRSVHENHGLDYKGSFDLWRSLSLAELPGKLNQDDRLLLHKLYENLIIEIEQSFKTLFQEHTSDFFKSLSSLLGKSSDDLINVICFHSGTNEYEFSDILIDKFNQETSLTFKDRSAKSNFEMLVGKEKLLQVRVKPMNKFTSKAFKINCSVRFKAQ